MAQQKEELREVRRRYRVVFKKLIIKAIKGGRVSRLVDIMEGK